MASHGRAVSNGRPLPICHGRAYRLRVDDDLRLEFLDALVGELIRSGVITEEMTERLADRMESYARHYDGNSRQLRYARMAEHARTMVAQANQMTEVEFAADFRRKQIRERTAMLECDRNGGNPPEE